MMTRFSILFLYLAIIWCFSTISAAEATFDDSAPVGIIEDNPDFIGNENSDSDNDSDSDSNSDSDYSDIEKGDDDDENVVIIESKNAKKSRISSKLKKLKTNKPKKKQKIFRILKKNRSKITIVLAVFAFRNEIICGIKKAISLKKRNLNTTDVLKLIIFVDFMRRSQASSTNSNVYDMMKKLSRMNPILSSILDKVIGFNPAYIPQTKQHFTFERLNEYHVKDGMALLKALETKNEGLKWPTASSGSCKLTNSTPLSAKYNSENVSLLTKSTTFNETETIVILDWTGLDTHVSSMEELRQQISFLLSEYRMLAMRKGEKQERESSATNNNDQFIDIPPALEVIVRLESPGGSVSDYGLLGQHLLRLKKESGLTLTICVDKVAASGGYLLCCTASPGKLFAAPFALVGSIGVIATQFNVNKALNNWGIQSLVFRGGKDKAPIGLVGEITKEGKRTTQLMIDDTHRAFKDHVSNSRPVLKNNIDRVANGNVWLGVDALELNLIDAIKTSDEYIEEKIRDGAQIFKMTKVATSRGLLFGPALGSSLKYKSEDSKIENSPSNMFEGKMQDMMKTKGTIAMTKLPSSVKLLFSKPFHYFNQK